MEQKMAAEKKKKNMMQLILHTRPNVLPNDIIMEILSRLSAKSLLRLRWVCKYWFDLITNNDSFTKMQLHRSTITIPSVLSFCFTNIFGDCKLYHGSYYLNYNDTTHVVTSELSCIGYPLDHIDDILGSCNGLVSFRTTNSLDGSSCLCIWNPCTKEYRCIPPPLTIEGLFKNCVISKDIYGFGYDQTMDDYKLIRIRYHYLDNDDLLRSDVQVYTLGTNSWRRIIGANPPYRLQNCSGVFLNGALYWMDFQHKHIISFDIGMEKFLHVSRIPNLMPNMDDLLRLHLLRNDHPQDYLHNLQVFEGSLCFVIDINCSENSRGEIWGMKDYTVNNSHNNTNNELLDKLLTLPHMPYYPIKLLRHTMNGEILMLNKHKDLVLYDTKTTEYQDLGSICKDYNHFSLLEVYTESLVSVNSGTYMDQPKKYRRFDDGTKDNRIGNKVSNGRIVVYNIRKNCINA